MKQCSVFSLALIVTALGLAAGPAGAAERSARPVGMLPAHEIITIVRSAGLKPVGKPTLKGSTYLLSAVDDEGSKMRVVIDGRVGEVISVTPVVYGREFSPMPPSVYDSGPPLYEIAPPVSRARTPIIIDEEPEPPVYRGSAPAAAIPIAPPPSNREIRERELRERDVFVPPAPVPPGLVPSAPVPQAPVPEVVASPLAPPPPSGMNAALPEGDDGELLPPPPPRFPQRVNAVPAAKPAVKPSRPTTAAKPNTPATAN